MSHWYAAAKRGLASLTKKQAKDRYHADRAAHHRAVLAGTLRDGTLGSVIPKHAAANFKASAANGTLGLWVRRPENLHELHKESYAMPRQALSLELRSVWDDMQEHARKGVDKYNFAILRHNMLESEMEVAIDVFHIWVTESITRAILETTKDMPYQLMMLLTDGKPVDVGTCG